MSEAIQRQARRATARAHMARRLGLVVAGVAVVVAGLFIWQSAAFGIFATPPAKPAATAQAPVVTASASTFTGTDEQQKPFEVNASNAMQDQDNADLVHLAQVRAKFYRTADHQTNLASNQASYNVKTRALSLSGQVVLDEPGRYTAALQAVTVNLDDKAMTTDKPVSVDFPGGKVEADAMTVASGGVHILFRGHVHAKLTNEFATATAKGEGG